MSPHNGLPDRVMVNAEGEATTPQRAEQRGVGFDIVFIRDDGWELGASREFAGEAYRMWRSDWIAYAVRKDNWRIRPIHTLDATKWTPVTPYNPPRRYAVDVSTPIGITTVRVAATGPRSAESMALHSVMADHGFGRMNLKVIGTNEV